MAGAKSFATSICHQSSLFLAPCALSFFYDILHVPCYFGLTSKCLQLTQIPYYFSWTIDRTGRTQWAELLRRPWCQTTFSLNDRLIRIYLSCRLLTGAGLIALTEFPLKFAPARSCGKQAFFLSLEVKTYTRNTDTDLHKMNHRYFNRTLQIFTVTEVFPVLWPHKDFIWYLWHVKQRFVVGFVIHATGTVKFVDDFRMVASSVFIYLVDCLRELDWFPLRNFH